MAKALHTLAWVLLLSGAWMAEGARADNPAPHAEGPVTPPSAASPPPEKAAVMPRRDADPESGAMAGNVYGNPYFGLSVPLPPDWSEGLAGPPPSPRGLYVLSSMDGIKASRATLLIVAQDLFFSAKPFANAADVAADLRASMAGIPDLSIDREPASITIGGRPFLRLDYHAGGLYRGWLATELRCHVVIFNITATDQATVDHVVDFLGGMSLPALSDAANGTDADAGHTPGCVKDYVTAQTTVRRVDPVKVDLNGLTVPVRITVGIDGKVRHVHVISATPAQRQAIELALAQWELKPLEVMGHAAEFETGLSFDFKPRRP